MAAKLSVIVKPKTALGSPASVKQSLFARLKYRREIPSEDETAGAPQTITIDGSLRDELDTAGSATLSVEDHANGTPFVVQIETSQGTALWQSAETPPPAAGASAEFAIPDSVFDAAQRRTPAASPTLLRAGRFVTLDDSFPDFSGYRLFIAAIRPAAINGSANPQTGAVRKILALTGSGEVTSFEVKRLDPKKLEPAAVNALGFQSATIRADGAFDVSIDITGDEIAWIWLLIGPDSFVGYQLDAVPTEPRPAAVILLPFVPARPGEAGDASGNGDEGADGSTAGPDSKVPMEYDERQLVDHPSTFSDDPGKFCTPFENPQRILGERRFFTVLRIDQPEIGGQGSLKVSRPIVLDLAPPIRMTAVANAIAARREEAATSPVTTTLTNLNLARLNLAAASQPRLDVRNVLNTDVFQPSRKPWIRWVRERSKDRKPVSGDNPIEWDGDPTIYQAATVAGGHVLEWRVQWRSNGYSLGNVAHTLTLAPRQTRRIAKVSWRRRETAVRRERTEAVDALTQVTTRARDYTDAVQSSLSEWSSGGSKSRTTGAAGGIGFAMGPVVIGGGAAHGQASSSSWQQGGRRVAAAEQQQLRDAIRQYGESVRSLESTVVTEIAQEEEVEGVSETLRNINYCHALSVLYYEILRHLRVDTSFAGVRECLFVPFSVTPFDIDKALKWRDKLRHGMLDQSLGWALDRLDEVASAWADSDIPPGRRMHHPVNFVSGSIYIQLSVDRPRDQGKEEALEDYYAVWRPFSPILAMPARRIIEALQRDERARDQYFQREVAPMMAARWANELEIAIGGNVISNADFTLASAYRFGDTVRIDFTVSINGALNREQMQQITVRSKQALPAGSVANLKRMSLHYFTDHFDREVQSDQGARDLVAVDTGLPDSAGALAHFVLSAWERENLREVIENAVEKLIVHLNANLVYYHKVVWWLMDRDELYMMLDGFTAPYGRRFENGVWVEDPGRSLASVVERDPMAILGNSLVFRVAAGAFLGIDGHESPDAAHRYYYDSQVRTEPLRVSLPTEGLYAQALMDKCMACEEHQGNTDWVLTDQEPELELIADQLASRRAAPESLTPTKLPDTIISLQNAPNAPDPSGLAGVLGAVTNAGAFRDMAGLAGTQANAAAAMQTAASLATNFGNQAANLELERRKLAASELDKQRASLQRAVDSKMLPPEDAAKHLNQLYSQATGGASSETPTRSTDELATNVANGLRPGQSGTVSRVTPSGAETVSIDSSKLLASTNFSEIRTQCGFPGAGRVVSESDLREFIRLRAEGERQAWIDPATNQILGENADEMFGRIVAVWLSVHGAIPPDALPILQANAADPATNYGQILDQNVATAVLNTEIARVRADILANVPLTHTPGNLDALIDEAIRRARLSRQDDPNLAFWSAAFVSFCIRNAAIDAGVEGMEQDTHSGRDELFVTAIGHLTFLQHAYRRRFGPTGQTKGTYHAFRPDEREPQVGDIIVQDRTANSINNVLAFQNIPNVASRGLHSDIVVEANPASDFVVCIGGNIGDSTRRRRFPLDANRRLLVQRQQLYTQEDASQSLPNIPPAGNAAGLPDFSTGRVFALMSPVEICIVIPGTRINGDVVT